MNNDGIVWEVLNNQFCSFKVKTDLGNLCRHPYNLTGRCNRKECPLANSRYATVRETNGRMYLCLKTAERAHMPAKQWEKIELPRNYAQAVAIIEENMQYWPNWMINVCKQRLTKITQYLIRMRKLKLKNKHTLVPIKKKMERREKSREIRAEAAARLDQSIEKELLERLRNKAYGDQPLNVNEEVWREILEGEAVEAESDVTTEDELEEENEYEMSENGEELLDAFVSDDSEDEGEDSSGGDMEDLLGMSDISSAEDEDEDDELESDGSSNDEEQPPKGKRSADGHPRQKPSKRTKKHGPRVEIEYETEAPERDSLLTNW
ncbi:Protein MAK16-like protein [Coemansia sp. RSA 989]|nr:Mak16 protein [Coemansia mojavensis]KAJ1738126.1 Protein MAK16-like protein [Coemansia sp. RSA 1086]KAJ1750653.1 Protein MAK16-like protein [Coemansia sp. RSA 1821]KAJ1865272.1 Protein MAK16-like protein [Coemansia sp. RSA 989]KAJ1872652.1 Protein MAK16-like protein [Coemansia sp. RSA 990]KAJ2647531.1 Protein MAK16-like protein [Coemansia sp. RSA 1250]KAJ2675591.1 Protein MAK16-like protein [Coemansia sp. RSA 1085]